MMGTELGTGMGMEMGTELGTKMGTELGTEMGTELGPGPGRAGVSRPRERPLPTSSGRMWSPPEAGDDAGGGGEGRGWIRRKTLSRSWNRLGSISDH